jgi:hypothetical protein
MDIIFKSYETLYRDAVIDVFKSNCPKYFDLNDIGDLTHFLDHYADRNFKIVFINNELIGCGGHYVKHQEQVFGIAWVMFRRFAIGQRLLFHLTDEFFNHILSNINKDGYPYAIVVNTTQLMEKTFHRYGFKTISIVKDGFGKQLDHYQMTRPWLS